MNNSRNTNRGGSGKDKILTYIIYLCYIPKMNRGLQKKSQDDNNNYNYILFKFRNIVDRDFKAV